MTRTAATIDLVILVLSLVGIRRASRNGDSPLARLLRTQGAAYFVMLFFLNVFMIASGSYSAETHVH